MARSFLSTILLIYLIAQCESWPGGAPIDACQSMMPQHGGFTEQADKGPFELVAQVTQEGIQVEIKTTNLGRPFKGFMISAFDPTGKRIGSFMDPGQGNTYKTLTCGDAPGDTATHNSSKAKHSQTILWIPPKGNTGSATFRATVVEEWSKFYMQIESNAIKF